MPSVRISKELTSGIYYLTFTVRNWYYIFMNEDKILGSRYKLEPAGRVTVSRKVEHGYSQKAIAGYLGLHYSTVSRLIKAYAKTAK